MFNRSYSGTEKERTISHAENKQIVSKVGPLCFKNQLGAANKILRALWGAVWLLLYRPSPTFLHPWRRFLLRLFGATVGRGAHPYPRCRIWAPWNLEMREFSCLANDVDCYSVASIRLGPHSTVSQHAHLCAATHDYQDPEFRLLPKQISIEERAWIAAGAFVGPGVTVGAGAVVGARCCAFKDVPAWTVVGGNPAQVIGKRDFRESQNPVLQVSSRTE